MLNLQYQWQCALLLSLQLLTRPFSEIVTIQLVGGTTHKLRPRSFQKVCITELIAWSFYTLCMSEPTPWTFIFKCELYLTLLYYFIISFFFFSSYINETCYLSSINQIPYNLIHYCLKYCWKIWSPKNITACSNNSFCIINAIFYSSSFFICILLYSHHKSDHTCHKMWQRHDTCHNHMIQRRSEDSRASNII